MPILCGEKMRAEYVKEYGRYASIIDFLNENESHRDIFCEIYGIEDLNEVMKTDEIFKIIESDEEAITKVMDRLAEGNTVYITSYNEHWDMIIVDEFKIIVEENESNAYVVYDERGTPQAYIIPTGELSQEQLKKLMEIFNGDDVAEAILRWREEV